MMWTLRRIAETFLTIWNAIFTALDVLTAVQVFSNLDKPEYAVPAVALVAVFSACLGWSMHSSYRKYLDLNTLATFTRRELALMLAIYDDEGGFVHILHGTEADRVAKMLQERDVVMWSDGANRVYPWHMEPDWVKFTERYERRMRKKAGDARLDELGIVRL